MQQKIAHNVAQGCGKYSLLRLGLWTSSGRTAPHSWLNKNTAPVRPHKETLWRKMFFTCKVTLHLQSFAVDQTLYLKSKKQNVHSKLPLVLFSNYYYCQNPNSTNNSIDLNLRLDYILTERSTHHPTTNSLLFFVNCPS